MSDIKYVKSSPREYWWCVVHQRKANSILQKIEGNKQYNVHCCDPSLGGIMIPCNCIDMTVKMKNK